jgi:hypothetical protein
MRLALEQLDGRRIARLFPPQQLDRDLSLQPTIPCVVDLRRAVAADRFEELVVGNSQGKDGQAQYRTRVLVVVGL